jgi:3'-phosphoadenosine 5'-phosphosulfate sulfotransferase (PAPS reductase)/FAD synthetase
MMESERSCRVPLQINPYAGKDSDELRILSKIDGFADLNAVAASAGIAQAKADGIVRSLHDRNIVRFLSEWTPLFWCDTCDLPLIGEHCGLCGGVSKDKITLRGPCNPKLIDKYFADVLRSLGFSVSGNMVINAFKEGVVPKFELIRGRKIAQFAFDDAEQRWLVESGSAIDSRSENGAAEDMDACLQRIVRANTEGLDSIQRVATDLIRTELGRSKWGTNPIVHHSGGKDAVVIFDLLIRASSGRPDNAINLLNFELGIDFPETQAIIQREISRYPGTVQYYHYSNREVFLKTIAKIGPPTHDNIWCCPQNAVPLGKLLRDIYGDRDTYISIKGHRKRESMEKMLWGPEHLVYLQHRAAANEQVLSPIWSWTDLEVWLYIHKNRLDYHPIYDAGIQRLVCVMCPVHSDSEQQVINQRAPEGLQEFNQLLHRWKEELGFPEEWITKRLWKKDMPVGAAMKELNIRSKVPHVSALLTHASAGEPIADGNTWAARGAVRNVASLPDLHNFLRATLGADCASEDPVFELDGVRVVVDEAHVLTVSGADKAAVRRAATRVSDLINVHINCIGCGFCADKCGCLTVVDGKVQGNPAGRTGCSKCQALLDICPVSRSKYVNFAHLFKRFRPLAAHTANYKY